VKTIGGDLPVGLLVDEIEPPGTGRIAR